MKVGILSDTHNHLDPQIARIFAGVDHILHAGDIGTASILGRLNRIAPVTAVEGNTDDPGHRYPQFARIELGGRTFLLHHIVDPEALTTALRNAILRETPDVVVYGHTHFFSAGKIGGVLFFNPGYAGAPPARHDRSVAVMTVNDTGLQWEKIPL